MSRRRLRLPPVPPVAPIRPGALRPSIPPDPPASPAPPESVESAAPFQPPPEVAFDEAMGELGVRELAPKADRIRAPTGPAAGEAPAPLDTTERRRHDDDAPRARRDDAVSSDPELADLLGRVRAVAGRRGSEPPARGPVLDLHGFSEADALHELRAFVERHRGGPERTLRIITGKGGAVPVLRPAVERWLRSASAIATVRSGHAGEGGDGVLVVSLKRRRRDDPPAP